MTAPPPRFGRGRTAARVLARVIDVAVWAGSRTPPGIAHGLAAIGGTLEWTVRPKKRRRLAANLAHAVGSPPDSRLVRRLVRTEIRNEAYRSADLLWALGRPHEFLAAAELDGIEMAQETVAAGHGLILVGTHLGGWEVATSVPGAMLGAPTSVIVADDWLAWAIEHARTAVGLSVVYPKVAALHCLRRLRAGEIVLMLGDDGRHAEHRHRTRFLDGEADLASGAATLSRLSRSPVITFTVLPVAPRRWRVIVEPPLGPPASESGDDGERELLQQLADRWTAMITAHPEHWAASHEIAWVQDG
ncbi:MAG: lysophospholipid acyltransferase family protein [Acidimicrobiia bacterium]|nr:lysophospholipid acyltransferase family protein [Acidimicrobiia bacterium]